LNGAGLSSDEAAASAGIRVLGLAAQRVAESQNKWAGLYRALGERFELVGTVHAALPAAWRYALRARHVRPDRAAWRARAAYDPRAFAAITRSVEPVLEAWDGQFELIVQLQTIFQPGERAAARTFVVYTDWTHALYARHSPLTSARSAARRRSLEAETARLARHVFTTSEVTRRSFVEDYGCDPQHVTAVGGGANTLASGPRPESDGPPRALFVGYDFERKGGEVVLRAWPEVRRRVPGAEILIAGPPARAAGGDGVRWLGRVEREDLADLYRSATVFVLPSLLEPWGFVFHEAMGQGLPCVATRAFAMPEIVDDGVTGLLVAPGDEAQLATALADLLGDRARAWRMGEEGRRRVTANHTWNHVVDRMAPAIVSAAQRSMPPTDARPRP
jgi:glycosyltransferase involved in cell wall biosynthesis